MGSLFCGFCDLRARPNRRPSILRGMQGQERRLVTVLFADFVGFTALADDLDPEELQMLVSGIFEDLAEEALRYDGTIEKFIGDAIFVIFGAPIAHEDDPQRALRCALGMQRIFNEHVARVKAQLGIELGLRIGIHSGMVVAGAVRSIAEYGVMGDTVNTASRVQQAAAPGEIYVTQATFRMTNREFSFREVGPIEMKGKEKPVLAYALTGERTTPRTTIDIQAPLVGRWMELSRLDLSYQSSRVGRTEVVLIAGEPGIGKSRLLTEFIGLATSAEDGVRTGDAPRVLRWAFSRVNQRSYAGFIATLLVEMRLEPLSDEEAARIIDATFDWIPDELRDKIVARAGGNPFFIEESIRALVDSGAVAKDDKGEWELRERPAALEVPATLHAVVAARVDRLPPTAKECIQFASVIGQRFGDRVLREAGGPRLADAVDELIAADLVLEAAPGERREGRYRFKHAVVQEVAYNTLLLRRRIEMHRRVAVAYEKVLGEGIKDFLPALAHHYLLGEVPDKAADYSWKAAERATAIHAHVEALRLAEQALELYEKLDRFTEAVRALYLIARVRRFRGENDAALSAYERALAMLEDRDPKSSEVGTVIAHMAELCTRWDAKHPDLDGLIARGLAIVDGKRDRDKVLLLAAKSFMSRKRPKPSDADWQASLATANEALAIAEELGLLREVSLCLDAVGYAYGELGNFRESYAHNQRRLPIAKSLQDSDELIDAHNMIAMSALVLGDFGEVIEHAAIARDIALETEKPRLGAVSLQTETLARLLSGDFAGAIAAAARRELFLPTGKVHATLSLAAAAAAAMGSPDEKTFREQLVEAEATPLDLAACDFVSAVYGMRESESSYHAIRSAGYPKGLVDLALFGPLAVLAAARWRIDDEPFEERIDAVIERTG